MKQSMKSPMLKHPLAYFVQRPPSVRASLHRNDANDTTPTKANTTAVEQRHVEAIGPLANLFEDFGVIWGKPGRESTFASLGFACCHSMLVIDGDLLFEGILCRQLGTAEAFE